MAELPCLKIALGKLEIGRLFNMPGDRNLFVFDEKYIANAKRPTLSLSFKDQWGGLLTDVKATQTRLPPFFANLLPEGLMRDLLANRAGLNGRQEFKLLACLGKDLPGAITAIRDDIDKAPLRPPAPSADLALEEDTIALHFSLAGVQLKFSASRAKQGFNIAADGAGGHWIIKLPDTRFTGVPENEYQMMNFARHMGIDVPETHLVSIRDVSGLPENLTGIGQHVFAIKRFDRQDDGESIHIEDFAQVFGLYPEKKYDKASYGNIATVIWAELGVPGITEFIRRFVFNALIANGDMHLKNWSLIYVDGIKPQLAPAYDFLTTLPYLTNDHLALRFVKSKKFVDVSIDNFKRFANKSGLPEKLIIDTVLETVERFKQTWPSQKHKMQQSSISTIIDHHLQTVPIYTQATWKCGF